MRAFLSSIIVALVLQGCGTVQSTSKTEKGSFPKTGALTTVNVGDVMVQKYDYIGQEQAILLQPATGSLWRGRNALPIGATLQKMTKDGKIYFCPQMTVINSACLMDTNNDKSFDKAYTLNGFGSPVNGASINPIPYRLSTGIVQSGFKYELVYQGVEGNVVSIAYREYAGDLARPAFYQDLHYTVDKPNTAVNFRDIRITIHQANNNQISYTVKSGLD